ncbi:hypothetical protein ACQPX6_00270 [Actinomycetospora sp. CA-101289]|uniref:hypothetical protein n=1 Tax=Actinomycetospora sp. CA-101289 TaxID=3239893 RepID=UPI003D98301D
MLLGETTVEREGRVWGRFETLSSVPMRGLATKVHDWVAFDVELVYLPAETRVVECGRDHDASEW